MTGQTAELHSVKKLGAYLGCDPASLDQALACQQHWIAQGIHKRLGEILLELQIVSGNTVWAALHAQRLDRLRHCTVFAGLNVHELAALCEFLQEPSIPTGAEFIRQEVIGGGCFIVA